MFALKTAFRDDVTFYSEGGGLHITIRLNIDLPEEEILKCSEAAKLPLMSTRCSYTSDAPDREFVIPFCIVKEETAAACVAQFHQCLTQTNS